MKKTLIVIDMQNDFVDGALGTAEAQSILGNVKKKIEQYVNEGNEVIFTRDTHYDNYLETNEGKYLPVKHCIKGTYGWMLADGIDIPEAVHIDKATFGYTDWKLYDFDEVEIIGLCTDICVVSNALIIKAQFPDICVSVDSSCCAGVTPESHEAALLTMKMCQIEVN